MCIITYAIATAVLGQFCMTVLKSPAEFVLYFKHSDFGKYETYTFGDIVVFFFLFSALNGMAFRLVNIRIQKHTESKMIQSVHNGQYVNTTGMPQYQYANNRNNYI